jgi:hypothetical protein
MADGRAGPFDAYHDDVLDRAGVLGWPEAIVEGLGVITGTVGWVVAVEMATPAELIALSRKLMELSV